jgi:hypothetical protein
LEARSAQCPLLRSDPLETALHWRSLAHGWRTPGPSAEAGRSQTETSAIGPCDLLRESAECNESAAARGEYLPVGTEGDALDLFVTVVVEHAKSFSAGDAVAARPATEVSLNGRTADRLKTRPSLGPEPVRLLGWL